MQAIEQAIAIRTRKAKEIATQKRIAKRGSVWVVPSASHQGHYVVSNDVVNGMPVWECSCPDYALRGQPCKHVIAVEIVRHREMPDGSTVTETVRVTYAQNWHAYNAAQVHEQEQFGLLLRDLVSSVETPKHPGAGRPRLPLADVVFGCAMKVFSTQSGRRADTDIRRAKADGLVSKAPSYNTLFRYMEDPAITPVLTSLIEQAALPLRGIESVFAVDSTGFANATYVRWFDEKWGKERSEKTWVKLHAMCGVKTHVVTSVVVTDMSGADCPQFKQLVKDTAKNFRLVDVTADKAYLSRENIALCDELGATPFIPFKDGTGTGLVDARGMRAPHAEQWRKAYHVFQYDRERFLSHYHARSNVESLFAMIKAKFGASIRSKSLVAQKNEALVKVLCHNVVTLNKAVYEHGVALGGRAA
jgi:transposase